MTAAIARQAGLLRRDWQKKGHALSCTDVTIAGLTIATGALAQTAIPDLRGTRKGESESIVLGGGNPHHAATPSAAPFVCFAGPNSPSAVRGICGFRCLT